MSAKSTARRAARPADGSQGGTTGGSGLNDMAALCMGLPWLKLWSDAWAIWSGQLQVLAASHEAASSDERRNAVAPWVPHFDATVIPFRRREDQPGMEATCWSLRLHVPAPPWLGASNNVIAIDTLVPRARKPETQD